MLPELTNEEFSAALDAAIDELLDRAGVEGPPVDALHVAHACKLRVAYDEQQSGRGRYMRLKEFGGRLQGSIFLRPEPRRERIQWAVAHELGEALAQSVFGRLAVDPKEAAANTRETVANALASRLLLPTCWLRDDAARLRWDLLLLKVGYATASHELIARRMLDFDVPVAITIFDNGRRTFRRSNACRRTPPMSRCERVLWQRVHEQGQPAEFQDWQMRIQAWPIHEETWKREILRTEPLVEPFDEPAFSCADE